MTKTAENDAYQEGIRVVWHSPTEYDAVRHGPPYLPGPRYEPVVLSSTDRKTVKAMVRTAAVAIEGASLSDLLGALQGAALVHQTHHWSCRGPNFYADHQLFERLYNESLEFIDAVAERIIGLGRDAILAVQQAGTQLQFVQSIPFLPGVEGMVQISLQAELAVVGLIAQVIKGAENNGTLSDGTSNLLEGAADKHETFIYLHKQRRQTKTASTYTYRR
jgi:starvation-inducible DNA-binding protein